MTVLLTKPSGRSLMILALSMTLSCMAVTSHGQKYNRLHSPIGQLFFNQESENVYRLRDIFLRGGDSTHSENPRIVAIALNLTLGLLGMHRLYLGTDLKVPILYTLTLGGGGILWLVDLGLLIFTKDITPYMDHPGVFMWTGK